MASRLFFFFFTALLMFFFLFLSPLFPFFSSISSSSISPLWGKLRTAGSSK